MMYSKGKKNQHTKFYEYEVFVIFLLAASFCSPNGSVWIVIEAFPRSRVEPLLPSCDRAVRRSCKDPTAEWGRAESQWGPY